MYKICHKVEVLYKYIEGCVNKARKPTDDDDNVALVTRNTSTKNIMKNKIMKREEKDTLKNVLSAPFKLIEIENGLICVLAIKTTKKCFPLNTLKNTEKNGRCHHYVRYHNNKNPPKHK